MSVNSNNVKIENDKDLQNLYSTDWTDANARARCAANIYVSPTPQTIGNSNGFQKVCLSAMTSSTEAEAITAAIIVSWVSVVICLLLGGAAIYVGVNDRALALVGLGVEILLDAQSSVIVIWRFKKPKERQYADEADAAKFKADRDTRREHNASISVAVVFIICAVFVGISALRKIYVYEGHGEQGEQHTQRLATRFEEIYCWPTALTFLCLSICKLKIAKGLHSEVLKLDALASFMSAIMAFVVGVAGIMEEVDGMWIADPIAAFAIAIVLFVTGFLTLIESKRLTKHQLFDDAETVAM